MRILIIEDEARIARRIERMTMDFFGGALLSVSICESLADGLLFLADHEIDVLLLDLNLNGEDGFDLLQNAVARSFHTIIVSAYTEKAITAFEYGVLDFVPKPFDSGRLAQAFLRITAPGNASGKGLRFLAVKRTGIVSLVDVDDLLYIKGAGIYAELHLQDGRQELHDKSLEKLAQLLPPSFVRIHKSYIVPVYHADKIIVNAGSSYHLLLKNGELLPIGRSRYKELKKRLL